MAADKTETEFTKFLSKKIDESQKSQRDIAREAGYPNANIISMLKNGETRLPLDRVLSMAKALGIDPRELFVVALSQFFPDNTGSPMHILFNGIMPDAHEARLIKTYRSLKKKSGATYGSVDATEKLVQRIEEAMVSAFSAA